jgi:hypothetical protein
MKEVIQEVKFIKEFDSKYGKLYSFQVKYDGKKAVYNSKSKEQKYFVAGQEVEFTEEPRTYTDRNGNPQEYFVVKPISPNGGRQSNFGRAVQKEQSRYSGFAMAYAKDLVVAKIISREEMYDEAEAMFNIMVALDKKLTS